MKLTLQQAIFTISNLTKNKEDYLIIFVIIM